MTPSFKGWVVLGVLLGTMAYAIAEDVTVTTYYPSPRGVYQELRVSNRLTVGSSTTGGYSLEVDGSFGGRFNGTNTGSIQLTYCGGCSPSGYYAYAVYAP